MKNFFSHDEGARNDPKLIKVLMRFGQAGKGVYWDLIEMLYEQDGYLMLSECESYAFALRTEYDLMQSLINDFGLFQNDGKRFWSESALKRLGLRKEKSQKAALSAQKRWSNADAMRTHTEGNAKKGKESKGKEIKEEGETSGVALPPQCSVKFCAAWKELIASPKWRKKENSALQLALEKLLKFDERYAIELMERAIMGNFQGVVFSETEADYRKWATRHTAVTGTMPTGEIKQRQMVY